jgi:S1-C subfamily serine protease
VLTGEAWWRRAARPILFSMTTPPRTLRRGRRAVLSIALLACLAPAHAGAPTSLVRDPAAFGPVRSQSPVLPMTDGVPGVVDVVSRLDKQGLEAAGTGIVLGPSGEVLTNNHVIRGARQIRVSFPGGPVHRAVVVGSDPTHDVALLAVRGAWQPTPATLGDSSTVAVGDPVQAVGNAGGVGVPSIAGGFITALDQPVTASADNGSHPEHLEGMIETNADIQPGDSGGPLINAAGQVIGMDTAASTGASDTLAAPDGFAIPINAAMAIVQRFQSSPPAATPTSKRRHPVAPPTSKRRHPRSVRGVREASLSRGARGPSRSAA